MWAQVWNIVLLVTLLTTLQVPTGEEEIKKNPTNHAYQNNNKNVKT